MKPKLNSAAKAKAKKAGKDKGVAYKKTKADKMAADANMTKAEKADATKYKKKMKDAWKAKKKKKFKGKMTLTGIDFTKADTATKSAKAAFEEATIAELDLTEEDEITFTYVKKAARRRLLAAGTTVSYEITVAEDTAVALEAKLTEDPEGTAILAMANAISTDFPEAVSAAVVSETVEGKLTQGGRGGCQRCCLARARPVLCCFVFFHARGIRHYHSSSSHLHTHTHTHRIVFTSAPHTRCCRPGRRRGYSYGTHQPCDHV